MPLRNWRWWPWGRSRRPAAPTAEPVAPPAAPEMEQSASGLTLAEATELVDLLERRGLELRQVDVAQDGRVTVRWFGPADPGIAGPAR